MAKILVISDHQDLKQSHSNRLILDDLERNFGTQIEVRRLSELYPDFHIDVAAEQAALRRHQCTASVTAEATRLDQMPPGSAV